MKVISVILLALVASSLAQQVSESSRQALENVDVDNILKNDKLVQRHISCVLNEGRCDSNGKDLKGNNIINCNSKMLNVNWKLLFFFKQKFCPVTFNEDATIALLDKSQMLIASSTSWGLTTQPIGPRLTPFTAKQNKMLRYSIESEVVSLEK